MTSEVVDDAEVEVGVGPTKLDHVFAEMRAWLCAAWISGNRGTVVPTRSE